MKNIKKFKNVVFGLLSSLLLAVGFVRAADSLDPINRQLGPIERGVISSSPDTVSNCNEADVQG